MDDEHSLFQARCTMGRPAEEQLCCECLGWNSNRFSFVGNIHKDQYRLTHKGGPPDPVRNQTPLTLCRPDAPVLPYNMEPHGTTLAPLRIHPQANNLVTFGWYPAPIYYMHAFQKNLYRKNLHLLQPSREHVLALGRSCACWTAVVPLPVE